VIVTTP
jgi:Mrp family chromosome partitioning ATPase